MRLLANRGQRLLRHADHVGGRMDFDPSSVDGRMARELGLDGVGTAYQLDPDDVRQRGERLSNSTDFGLRRMVAPHRVYRDADHAQASSTSISFLPR